MNDRDPTKKGKYQIFHDLLPDEYEALKTSIAERWLDIPIIVDQDGEAIRLER
jgi:ParB-like chromosome segregation protein Spo0J